MIKIKNVFIKSKNKTLLDIKFDIKKSTALVGQSGSGKTLLGKLLVGVMPSGLKWHKDISHIDKVRIVPQNPFTSLSPMTLIKDQFFCDINKAKDILIQLKLDTDTLDKFPSQLSGGQLQRVVIAMAIVDNPTLLILDEPTTSLDWLNKDEILQLIKSLQKEFGFYILYITHDIGTVKVFCDTIVVIKKGLIVEQGLIDEVLNKPQKSYTKKLISSTFKRQI